MAGKWLEIGSGNGLEIALGKAMGTALKKIGGNAEEKQEKKVPMQKLPKRFYIMLAEYILVIAMKAVKELEFITKNPKKVERFAGQWIAVLDRKILASGKTVDEAIKKSHSKRTPLVFKVPRKDEEMYIL